MKKKNGAIYDGQTNQITKSYTTYVISTAGFGIMAILGLIGFLFFIHKGRFGLFIITALIVAVSLDNFFCAKHLRDAGGRTDGHYTIPPFLRRSKVK